MGWLVEAFVEPVARYPFMRDGLAVAAIVGITSAVLSCLLVVRRQALLGDAIAHAVLLGVALGWVAAGRVGILWGAILAGVGAGLAITYLERASRVPRDAAMGVVFTTAFALGLAIISVVRPAGIDLFHVLFGNVLGVSTADLWLTGLSGAAVLAVVVALFGDFHAWSFDAEQAGVLGVPTTALHYLFTALLSATVVASLQALGVVLVVAMLIIPGATALLLCERLATMMRVAAVLGLVAAVTGLYGSYHVDVASGPAIVLAAAALFALAFAFAPRRGVVSRALRRRRRTRRALEEDLLKTVYKAERERGHLVRTTTLAGRAEVDERAARRALARLARRGLVHPGEPARTTADGQREAVRIVRAHRLLETYLHDAERFTIDQLHAEAERLEHDLTDADVEDLADTLGRPATDPHGHPIPDADEQLARIAGRPLAELAEGASGRVVMVADDRDDLLRVMLELGLLPDTPVTVLAHRDDGVRVRLPGGATDVPAVVADRVYVTASAPADAPR